MSSSIWEEEEEGEEEEELQGLRAGRLWRKVIRLGRRRKRLVQFFKAWLTQVAPWVVLSLIYFGCIVALFAYEQNMCWFDAIYFSVTLLTTVGFGDLVPTTTRAKLMTITAVVSGILIGAAVAEFFFNRAIRKALESARVKERMRLTLGDALTDEQQLLLQKSAFLRQLRRMGLFIMMYVLLAKVVMNSSWLDAVYFVVITCTTVGFGDIVPDSPWQKVIMAGTMLIGIPLFGNLLGGLIELLQGNRVKRDRLHKVTEINEETYMSLEDFCKQMRDIGLYSESEDGFANIDRFEFLCYLLVRSDILSTTDLQVMMDNFMSLDLTRDGQINFEDVQEFVRRRELREFAEAAAKEKEAEPGREKLLLLQSKTEEEEEEKEILSEEVLKGTAPVPAEPSHCLCVSQVHELRQILLRVGTAALPHRSRGKPPEPSTGSTRGSPAEGPQGDDCGCGRGGRPFDDQG